MGESRRDLLVCILLALVTLGVYAQVRHHDFINLDDPTYIVENPAVQRGLTPETIRWAMGSTRAANWHPLTWISHTVDVQLFGLRPGRHHLVSVLFHTASSVLLFLFLRRATGALWRSGLVAALFALHPLHVQSVAWASERKDVLSGFFWMLTLLAYTRYAEKPRRGRYLVALGLFALGLAAKPMLVTLPFVLLLLDYWPLRRFQPRRCVLEKAPFFVLATISSAVTVVVQQRAGATAPAEGLSLGVRVANAAVSYVAYMGKTVWPRDLAVFYPHRGDIGAWEASGAALILLGATLAAIRAARRFPYALVGWSWYLGTLVPVIGLVQVGSQAMADRYTYIPLIGLFVLLAWGSPDLLVGWRLRKEVLTVASFLLLAACAVRTRRELAYWKDSTALFERALAVTAGNYVAHNGLGLALEARGNTDPAVAHYSEAVRLRSGYADARSNLGAALNQQGGAAEAMIHLTEAGRLRPRDARVHNNLGSALNRLGRTDEAIAEYSLALRLEPDFAAAHYNLGNALLGLGRAEEAIAHHREATRLRPGFVEAHNNLGFALLGQHRFGEAIASFSQAVRLRPDFSKARANLALALHAAGRTEEAVVQYVQMLQLAPDWPEGLLALARIRAAHPDPKLRRGEDAVRLAERGCELAGSEDPSRLDTLAAAYAEAGLFPKAVRTARRALVLASSTGREELAAGIRERLSLYEAGTPFRETQDGSELVQRGVHPGGQHPSP